MKNETIVLNPYNHLMRHASRYARQWMTISLVITDSVSLLLAFLGAIVFREMLLGKISLNVIFSLWPILVLFILAFFWRGLYPAVGLSPVDELSKTTSTVSVVFLLLLAGTFWIQISEVYSRLILTTAWLLAMVLVQVDRWILRVVGGSFWGEPIAIIGFGPSTQYIVNYLNNNNHLGLVPRVVLEGGESSILSELESLKTEGIHTVLLVMPEVSGPVKDLLLHDKQINFRRLILISTLGENGSLGVTPWDLEGVLGLEVHHNLLNLWQRYLKRMIDLLLAPFLLVLVSPFLLVISIMIQLEGPGGVFLKQRRIGQNGHEFMMWKFRTMVPDADKKLQDVLKADPQLEIEWNATQKLKNDPRLTRIGKLLRKWSLDEIPQLINVIHGEMSLVGPRPCFAEQVSFYGNIINLYYRVRPGMTGMWQVSGRSEMIYAERVRLDEYYVRNWSIWLDVYLIIRTVWVVITRKGAY